MAEILQFPTPTQVKAVTDWLFQHPDPNLDLEVALNLVLTGQINPAEAGGLLAIAHTPSPSNTLTPQNIRGALIASPDNRNVSLIGSDPTTCQALFALVQARKGLYRVALSQRSRDCLLPHLLQHYHLDQFHTSLIMKCTEPPPGGAGRWATPQDKPALQAYIEAVWKARNVQGNQPNWDILIQQQRIAVLDHQGQVVSIAKRGATAHEGAVVGMFTFTPFRQQGFAKRLLTFLLRHLLRDYPTVKLWTDEDNHAAIALYESVGFQTVGAMFTGYFRPKE